MDVGDTVPALLLLLQTGETRSLADYGGRWVILYFYPKDSTPGCTTEGRDFNALLPQFDALGATVLGVSRDSPRSHANFCAKQGFQFDLVSDADEKVCAVFDVVRDKSMYGRLVRGIERCTFLIDPEGRLARTWRPVKVAGHADAVLATLRSMQPA